MSAETIVHLQPDVEEIGRFIKLLGKSQGESRLRAFFPGGDPRKEGDWGRKGSGDPTLIAEWQAEGRGVYMVINNGGDTGAEITACRALFCEWDDREIEWQKAAWQELKLPEPTFQVETGGKSIHCYWVLTEPLPPERWKPLQKRLLDHAKADPSLKDLPRVMRLPGCRYMRPGNEPGPMVRIINATGKQYGAAELEACLPEVQPSPPAAALPRPGAPADAAGVVPLVELLPQEIETLVRSGSANGTRNNDCARVAISAVAIAPEAAAAGLVVDGTPESVVLNFASRCRPPMAEGEALACLRSAQSKPRTPDPGWHDRLDYQRKRQELEQQQAAADGALPFKDESSSGAAAGTAKRPPVMPLATVKDHLQEGIADGVCGAELVALIAELATASHQPPNTIQKLADAIRAENWQAADVRVEAANLAAEIDRQEIGQALTAAYLLPATIADAIETRTRYLPCHGPSAVLPFLAAVAGVVKLGTEVEAAAAAGYRVPVNLFACLVARSGAKKSPIGRLLVDEPLRALLDEINRSNARERQDWEDACRELKRSESKPPEPQPRRVKAADFTGEALAAQLQTQEAAGLRLLVNRDELSGLFGSLNQYRGGRGGDEQQLLELFDGGGLSSLRVTGGRHYSRSQVSVWGSTQPEVLRQLVANGDASGLWARFLFVPLPAQAIPLPDPATDAAEVAAKVLADACEFIYRLPPQTYRLSHGAAEQFTRYEHRRQQAALKAAISAQSALYGKSAAKVLRLAGALHLLQIAAGELGNGEQIQPHTIKRAIALVDHLDAWAMGLHAEVATGAVGGLLRLVHGVAEAAGGPIQWRDINRRLSKPQRKEVDSAAAAAAMRELAAAGFGEIEEGKRGALSYRALRGLP